MATKKVRVRSHDARTNLQIIKEIVNGVPLFEPHEKPEDRVRPPDGTELVVLDTPIKGSGLSNPEYYYITDKPSNGAFRRYFIKEIDVV